MLFSSSVMALFWVLQTLKDLFTVLKSIALKFLVL